MCLLFRHVCFRHNSQKDVGTWPQTIGGAARPTRLKTLNIVYTQVQSHTWDDSVRAGSNGYSTLSREQMPEGNMVRGLCGQKNLRQPDPLHLRLARGDESCQCPGSFRLDRLCARGHTQFCAAAKSAGYVTFLNGRAKEPCLVSSK